ncbi:MAG: hypothetical protein ACI81P_002502 [Neolewinella sp.]|jgi:hypothetical protein
MLLVLNFFLALSLTSYPAPPDAPVEWIGETTVDMGDLVKGQDHEYTFQFRNLTDTPILVDNVRAGCGCTATEWENIPVAPGEIGSINVTYDAMNVGYFRKYVKVFFHKHKGAHKLWLEGFVD